MKKAAKPTSPTHAELIALGCRWLRTRRRLALVLGDFRTIMTNEQPDCIGWNASGWSVLIECKVSRADFLQDKHKTSRRIAGRGMGQERFFLAPEGMVRPDELPEGWGLLEPIGKGVGVAREAARGVSARPGLAFGGWDQQRQREELVYLLAFVRRALGITKLQRGRSQVDDIQAILRMVLPPKKFAVTAPLVTGETR